VRTEGTSASIAPRPAHVPGPVGQGGIDPAAVELTILMPCLNEAETLATCITKARDFLERSNTRGEILIADNGSSDGSVQIAEGLGARVVPVAARGYGAALLGGLDAARGTFIVMGDADDSYDFSRLEPFLEKLREGNDLVMGNRFQGGIAPGAMPFLHRYLGNPVLSFIGRLFFEAPVGDFHCGLRGFRAETMRTLGLKTTGMEFASEMVVRSCLARLRIAEVPTTLKPDGRTRAPHLKTWGDGWRHLKFLLIYSPKWLFLLPGTTVATAGLLLGALLMFGPVRFGQNVVLDLNTFVAACLLTVVGVQLVTFGALARFYATITEMLPRGARSDRLLAFCTTDRLVQVAAVLFAVGAGLFGFSVYQWAKVDFGNLTNPLIPRFVTAGLSIMIVGVQIGFAAFLFGILSIPLNRGRA
jgi:hypothetical protein